MVRRSWLVAVPAAVALAVPGGALAAAIGGARYAGHSDQGRIVDFQVRPDGTALQFYEWSVAYRCNKRWLRHTTFGVAPRYGNYRVAVRAGSTFRLRKRERNVITDSLGGRVLSRGHVTYAFSGRFSASGRTATGRVSARYTGSRGVRCDSRSRRYSARTFAFAPQGRSGA